MFKITDLKPQKNDSSRLNVYLDGEFGFGIARVIAPWLKVGAELDQAKIDQLVELDAREKAYQRALHYLSYRVRSEHEVQLNLEKYEIPPDVIEDTLERLRGKSLVNDHQFASQWVENRAAFHPRGKRALSSELRQKGVSPKIIDDVLENVDEYQLAEKVMEKKINRAKNLDWNGFRKKMYGYLSRRGFHFSICNQIVQEKWDQLQTEKEIIKELSEN